MLSTIGNWLFDPSGLTPHGFCLLWQPGLILTHALADSVIGLAYFAIPLALVVIARQRSVQLFTPVFWLTAAFILLCGTGHWLDLITLWVPIYGLEGAIKAITAVVSIVTALVLARLLPQVLTMNMQLREDIRRGKETEAVLRAARDAADAAARAKTEFLATMSHEIRSPMSGLVGVMELLRESSLDAEQSRMLGMAHSSALGLLAVLNDILDFSKIESGALAIVPEPTDIRALITHITQPHIVQAGVKGVELTIQFGPGIPALAMIDPLRLRQIINNLVGNAVKFTEAGEIGLRVLVSFETPETSIRFTVQDTGIGMTEAVLGKLFQPFTQADGSTSRDYGGTGLGLCISRRLAGLLDGTLTAASRPGQGSTFTLVLPLRPVAAPQALRAAPSTPAASPPSAPFLQAGGGQVLVVDDEATNRWITQRQVKLLGFDVAVAENGEVALAMLRAGQFRLLLTDCHMPKMDGVALARAVRSDPNPALRDMPIIGLTADVTVAQSERCHEAGMTHVAIKPLSRAGLARLLSRHLPDPNAAPPAPEAVPAANAAAAFDDSCYRELFDMGDPEGEIWFAEFLAAAGRLYGELQNRLAPDGDPEANRAGIEATAHRLAGAALSVGAMRLGEAARALEHAASGSDPTLLRARNAALREEFARARDTIEAFMAGCREGLTT